MLTGTVVDVSTPTPLLRRLVVRVPGLGTPAAPAPGQWVRLYVPEPQGTAGRLAVGAREMAGHTPRSYTVQAWDPAQETCVLDFVLHQPAGPASTWAAAARTGDELPLAGPIGRPGLPLDAGPLRVLFLADTTALPAVRELVGALPRGSAARAVIAAAASERVPLAAPDGVALTLDWTDPGGDALTKAATVIGGGPTVPSVQGEVPVDLGSAIGGAAERSETHVWVGAEAGAVSEIRRLATTAGVPRPLLHATAYWRRAVSA
ncbi:MAG: siderophore-interacting protein [Bifidobacteriaceae bacterium]|nr:siderophore-interacting protein [Bifidobacteriaceae bacterium]